jgi:hypothetical protein
MVAPQRCQPAALAVVVAKAAAAAAGMVHTPSKGLVLDPKLKDLVRQVLSKLPKSCAPPTFMAAFIKMHGSSVQTFVSGSGSRGSGGGKAPSKAKFGDIIRAMPDVARLVQMEGIGNGTNLYVKAVEKLAATAAAVERWFTPD